MGVLGSKFSPRVQVGVLVVALAVAGVLTYRAMSGPEELSEDVNFVCVASGKTFSIDRDNVTSLPVQNPETKQATLVPCVRREGKLFVDRHYRSVLEELAEVNQYVDKETLAVKSKP
jgi:hypothetical protein